MVHLQYSKHTLGFHSNVNYCSLFLLSYFFFKEHEVEKMFTLKSGRLPSADVKNIIFFVRPRLELMDIIAENVYRLVDGHC